MLSLKAPPPTHPPPSLHTTKHTVKPSPEMGTVLTKVVKFRPAPSSKKTREVEGRKALAVTCTSGTWQG